MFYFWFVFMFSSGYDIYIIVHKKFHPAKCNNNNNNSSSNNNSDTITTIPVTTSATTTIMETEKNRENLSPGYVSNSVIPRNVKLNLIFLWFV